MRVQDLKQVTTIDQEITVLQQQLTALYEARATLLEPASALDDGVRDCYKALVHAWERVGIQLPEMAALEPLLKKAIHIKKDWEAIQPAYQDALQILLVPPASVIGMPAHAALREKQRLLQGADSIDATIQIPRGSAKWRVLVAYAKEKGVLLKEGEHLYDGRPAVALGMQEYTALTLQLSQPIDTTTWTSFVGKKSHSAIIYAGCRRGRYRFGINDIHGALDDDRFRPAVEVKV